MRQQMPFDAMNQPASMNQTMNMNGPMGFNQQPQVQNPVTSMQNQRQIPATLAGQGLMNTVVSDPTMQVVSIVTVFSSDLFLSCSLIQATAHFSGVMRS